MEGIENILSFSLDSSDRKLRQVKKLRQVCDRKPFYLLFDSLSLYLYFKDVLPVLTFIYFRRRRSLSDSMIDQNQIISSNNYSGGRFIFLDI